MEFNLGSPPRMRGKHCKICPYGEGGRITPRACGENCYTSVIYSIVKGSPPRMRGKREPQRRTAQRRRITPAHAGKTCVCTVRQADTEDHPRACGENYRLPRREYRPVGSPPRMRGKLFKFPQKPIDK